MVGVSMIMASQAMDTSNYQQAHSTPELVALQSNTYDENYEKPLPRPDAGTAFNIPSFDDFNLDTSVFLNSGAPSSSATPSSTMSSPNPQLDDDDDDENSEYGEENDRKPTHAFNQNIFSNPNTAWRPAQAKADSKAPELVPDEHSPTQRSPDHSPKHSPRSSSSTWRATETKNSDKPKETVEPLTSVGTAPSWRPSESLNKPKPPSVSRRPSAVALSTMHSAGSKSDSRPSGTSRRPSAVAHSAMHRTDGRHEPRLGVSGRRASAGRSSHGPRAAANSMEAHMESRNARATHRPKAILTANLTSLDSLNEATPKASNGLPSASDEMTPKPLNIMKPIRPTGSRRPSAVAHSTLHPTGTQTQDRLEDPDRRPSAVAHSTLHPTDSAEGRPKMQGRRPSAIAQSAVESRTAGEPKQPRRRSSASRGQAWRPTDPIIESPPPKSTNRPPVNSVAWRPAEPQSVVMTAVDPDRRPPAAPPVSVLSPTDSLAETIKSPPSGWRPTAEQQQPDPLNIIKPPPETAALLEASVASLNLPSLDAEGGSRRPSADTDKHLDPNRRPSAATSESSANASRRPSATNTSESESRRPSAATSESSHSRRPSAATSETGHSRRPSADPASSRRPSAQKPEPIVSRRPSEQKTDGGVEPSVAVDPAVAREPDLELPIQKQAAAPGLAVHPPQSPPKAARPHNFSRKPSMPALDTACQTQAPESETGMSPGGLKRRPLGSNPALRPDAIVDSKSAPTSRKPTPDPTSETSQWPLGSNPVSHTAEIPIAIDQRDLSRDATPVPSRGNSRPSTPNVKAKEGAPTPPPKDDKDPGNAKLLSRYTINVKLAKDVLDDVLWGGHANHGHAKAAKENKLEPSFAKPSATATSPRRSWLSSSNGEQANTQSLRRGSESRVGEQETATPEPVLQQPQDRSNVPSGPNIPWESNATAEPVKQGSKALSRATNYLSRIKQKQGMGFMKSSPVQEPESATTPTPGPTMPLSQTTSYSTEGSDSNSIDSSSEMPMPSDDPLWPSFKNLQSEFRSFSSKHTSQRMLQVQSWVLPFLRKTKDNTSVRDLFPEEIERRCVVLNHWWNLILEMLDSQGAHSITSVDRPFLFDALTMIMERDEWRQSTPYFLQFVGREAYDQVRAKSPAARSEKAAYTAGAAEYNIRTMFAANLIRQMSYVVDKMSLRHTSSSLIKFSGATCAQAFFFAPGVAEVLSRLWGLTPDLIRRAADELGLPRRNDGKNDEVVSLFPPKLAGLGWTSPKAMSNYLKKSPRTPTVVARIPWTGGWLPKWKGEETDLLFIFCKHFHIVCEELLPAQWPITDKARSPGFVLVQAQLLSIIDDTIHRQSAMQGSCGPGSMDGGPGFDGPSMTLAPVMPPNLMKEMSENRIVVMLKKFLTEESRAYSVAQGTCADACARMIRAAARKTSQFDNAACHSLCDFLEEVLHVYDEFEYFAPASKYLDWPFWLDALQKMLDSLSSTVEVRVFAFLYSNWDTVARSKRRKTTVCSEWLLTEENFNKFFYNWCPMVRAYYHRLLCWRICRDEGKAGDTDSAIFRLVAIRLKKTWSQYLFLKEDAEEKDRLPPATTPMLPMQGKKFVIVRQENDSPPSGTLMDFDSLAKTSGVDVITADEFVEESTPKQDAKKRKSLLGKVLSLTASGGLGANANSPRETSRRPSAWDDERPSSRKDQGESRRPSVSSLAARLVGSSHDADSRSASPVTEEEKVVFRFALANQNPQTMPGERELQCPRLPAPAQLVITFQSNKADTISVANEECDEPSVAVIESPTNTSGGKATLLDEPEVRPAKPAGTAAANGVYSGRALAEWAQAVAECNNFVDRRCDEGVTGLKQVQVPLLGVEGFRKLPG